MISNVNWWNKDVSKEDIYSFVFSAMDTITINQQYRENNNLKFAALYSNQEILGMYGSQFYGNNSIGLQNRVTLNVIKACIDTAASKIAKAKPRIMFLTDKGNYSQKRRSKQLTQYLEGAFDYMGLYQKAPKCFTHSATMGTGFLKFYIDYDRAKVECEHILTSEIVVDDNEAVYGNPQTLYQRKYVDREVLAAKFPEHRELIMSIAADFNANTPNSASTQVLVIESWRLPSKKGAKNGKWAISVENCTLDSDVYKKDYFPFVAYRYNESLVGYWGKGIAEELTGIQIEINKILRNIQRAQKLMSVPRIFIDEQSDFNPEVMSNEFGAWYKYAGNRPTSEVFQAMSSEVYQHLWNLYDKAFEIVGISQLSASGEKPAGLDAAVALRTYQDIQTERFSLPALAYQKIFEESSKIILDLSKDLYEENPELEIKANVGKFIKSIKWSDVYMADDEYILRAFPVSILPSEPAAKLQFIQELIQGGYIDKQFGQSLLDFPDLDGYMSIGNASVDCIASLMESILEDDKYIPPTPYMDLLMSQQVAQKELLRGEADGLPEDNKEMLRLFISDCQLLIDKQNGVDQAPTPTEQENMLPPVQQPIDAGLAALPPIGIPTGAIDPNMIQPQAVPTAPPVSPLIPNVPQQV